MLNCVVLTLFNLMSRVHETIHTICHKSCTCICRLTSSIWNSWQVWNKDCGRCVCKELVDKGICDKGYTWNSSNCNCECDKSCGIGNYLDYKSCVGKNTVIDKLIEEYTNIIDKKKIYIETLNTISSEGCILVHYMLYYLQCF